MTQLPASLLYLNDLKISVRLGNSEEERSHPQLVRFDLKIRFESRPESCINDQLADTVCYATLCEKIQKICSVGEYRLIEKLTWEVHFHLKEYLPPSALLYLKITKDKLPFLDQCRSASFSLCDWGGHS